MQAFRPAGDGGAEAPHDISLAGLWLDPRLITGAPVWLKPAKFAVSVAIYLFTMAWVFTYLETPSGATMTAIAAWALGTAVAAGTVAGATATRRTSAVLG